MAPLIKSERLSHRSERLIIPIFEELKTQNPRAMNLALMPYKRLPVSRPVIRWGNRNHHVGLFSSRKNRAMVEFESALERDVCIYFESRPEIFWYSSQPDAIRLRIGGNNRTVFPDFKIKTRNKRALIDVKYYKKTQSQKFIARKNALISYARYRDLVYSVVTERDVRTPRLVTARVLLAYARGLPSELLIQTVIFWLQTSGGEVDFTYENLLAITANYPAVQSVIAGLVLDGILVADLDQELSEHQVHLRTTEESN